MPDTVTLCGMIEPHPGVLAPGDELWAINKTYLTDQRCTRVYFFDDIEAFSEGFVADLNEVDVPVYTRRHYPQIKRSVPFPISEIIRHFGIAYFTCTAAYMVAHAIYEGYGKIVCSGMYSHHDSLEYLSHVACVNFWLATARASGITAEVTGKDIGLMSAFPWESNLYGYERNINNKVAMRVLNQAYVFCAELPAPMLKSPEYPECQNTQTD